MYAHLNKQPLTEKNSARTTAHLGYLDATRGIAALSVMAYHFINWRYEHRLPAQLGSILFNGSDAVSYFFVLSGFVLSYQYIVSDKKMSIPDFYISRFFRLWPAFFLTVVLNALNWNRANLHTSNLLDVFLYNKTHFWQEALLIRSYPQYYIPGWTLTIELSISFMVPFLIVLAKANARLIGWLLFAILLIGGNMGDFYMFHFHFALGVLLSCIFVYLNNGSFKKSKWYNYRYLLLFAALLLYSLRHIERIMPFPAVYTNVAKYLRIDLFHYTAVASFVFIAFIIQSERAKKLLQNKTLLFLGKISYGIYLSHWLLVTDIFSYWDRIRAIFPNTITAFTTVFFLYTLATIVLATVIHYCIELPFIRLGKRMTSKRTMAS